MKPFFVLFQMRLRQRKNLKIIYHGTIVRKHGLHIALDSINRLKDTIPNISFHIYGNGDYVEAIQDLIQDLKLSDIVFYHREISLEVIAHAIDDIDIGLIPNLKTPFMKLDFPTRIFIKSIVGMSRSVSWLVW